MTGRELLQLLAAFLFGLALLCLCPGVRGESCAGGQSAKRTNAVAFGDCATPAVVVTPATNYVNAHAIVYPSNVVVQAVPVAVPLYSASAPGLSPEVTLLLQQIAESVKQTNALLNAHEQRLQQLEGGVRPLPAGLSPSPRMPQAPADVAPPAGPQAAGGLPKLFTRGGGCMQCHDGNAARGGGRVLFAGGQFSGGCADLVDMLDAIDSGAMPKGGQATEEEGAEAAKWIKQAAHAAK